MSFSNTTAIRNGEKNTIAISNGATAAAAADKSSEKNVVIITQEHWISFDFGLALCNQWFWDKNRNVATIITAIK